METAGPNEIWPADLKGQFKTGDRKYCFPLTVTDHYSQLQPTTANYSRMILLCKALRLIRIGGATPAFRTLFREYGLPDAIRTDNGPPLRIHGNPWTPRTQCVVDNSGSWIREPALRAHIRTSTRANAQRHEARGSQSVGCRPDHVTEATESLPEALLP